MASAHVDSLVGEYAHVTSLSAFYEYIYTRKAASFQQWKVFDFSMGVYGGRGFWAFVTSFACHMYNFSFCEYIRAKAVWKYINAGYNYVNRFIVGIMLFKVRTLLRVGSLVWWSLSPNNFNGSNANVWNVNGSNGNFDNNNVNNTNGVRPYFLLN